MPGGFQFGTFLSVALTVFRCMSASWPSSSPFNSFSCYLSNQRFCYVLSVPTKLFYFLCIWLLVCHRTFYTNLWVEFSFVIWNILFCLYCLTLSRYLLSLPSFANIFWYFSFKLHCQILSAVLIWSFHPNISSLAFSFLVFFRSLLQFICLSF